MTDEATCGFFLGLCPSVPAHECYDERLSRGFVDEPRARPRHAPSTVPRRHGRRQLRTSTLCTHVSGLLVCSTAIDRRNAGMRCDAPADAADAFPTRLTPNPRTEPTRNHIPRCKIWAQGPRGRQGWGRSGAEARGARRGWTNGWTHARTHELKGIRASTLKRLLRSPFFRVPRIKS